MYLNTLQIVFWITYGMNVILDISGLKVSLHNNLEDMVRNLVHIEYYLAQYQIPTEYIKIHLKEYVLKFLPKSLPISKWTVSSCWHNNGRCFYYNQFQMFDHNKKDCSVNKTRKSPKLHSIFVIVQCHIWWARIDKMGQTMKIEAFLISRQSLKITGHSVWKLLKRSHFGTQNIFEF